MNQDTKLLADIQQQLIEERAKVKELERLNGTLALDWYKEQKAHRDWQNIANIMYEDLKYGVSMDELPRTLEKYEKLKMEDNG